MTEIFFCFSCKRESTTLACNCGLKSLHLKNGGRSAHQAYYPKNFALVDQNEVYFSDNGTLTEYVSR